MSFLKITDCIAIISINNPPVNSLSLHVRKELIKNLNISQNQESIKAVIIIGNINLFSAGADITEFKSGVVFEDFLPTLINKIENFPKPVICAMNGIAFGGGFEIALGCHYRIASSNCKISLPEIKLGLIPGAGATQRLPRLIGIILSSKIICSGSTMNASEAYSKGIIDKISNIPKGASSEDGYNLLIKDAKNLFHKIKNNSIENRRISKKNVVPLNFFFYSQIEKDIKKRARGLIAPVEAFKCIIKSTESSFEDGLNYEQSTFKKLAISQQSKAMQHLFFSERKTISSKYLNSKNKDTLIKIGIIGGGVMGTGIAINFLDQFIEVTLIEKSQKLLERGVSLIKKHYDKRIKANKDTDYRVNQKLSCLKPTIHYNDVKNVDIVIEAVYENMEIKKEVLKRVDVICKNETILCTNTSTLSIDELANVTKRPQKVIGAHFFSPANIMKLLEIVEGKNTSFKTIKCILNLSRRIKKIPVLVKNCFGFVGNRMLFVYLNQAFLLLNEGCLPYQIDKVLYKFGLAMGPFAVSDLSGNDVGYHIRLALKTSKNIECVSEVADKLFEMKKFGIKTGDGWYKYKKGSRKPIVDEEINKMVVESSNKKGYKRRKISDKEILERCLYSLINEGLKILEEGIAEKASDIDIIWVYGYGFPPYKGGPMYYADMIGIKSVYEGLLKYSENCSNVKSLSPCNLLKDLVNRNLKVGSYGKVRSKL